MPHGCGPVEPCAQPHSFPTPQFQASTTAINSFLINLESRDLSVNLYLLLHLSQEYRKHPLCCFRRSAKCQSHSLSLRFQLSHYLSRPSKNQSVSETVLEETQQSNYILRLPLAIVTASTPDQTTLGLSILSTFLQKSAYQATIPSPRISKS